VIYICEYSFVTEDPTIPGYSSLEVDFYAWTPQKFHSQIPDHRLSLMKNLTTGKYEFHRVYMKTLIGVLRGLGIVVTQKQAGYTEVAYKTENLQEAIDWGNQECKRFHYEPGAEHSPSLFISWDNKVCQHEPPHMSSFCERFFS